MDRAGITARPHRRRAFLPETLLCLAYLLVFRNILVFRALEWDVNHLHRCCPGPGAASSAPTAPGAAAMRDLGALAHGPLWQRVAFFLSHWGELQAYWFSCWSTYPVMLAMLMTHGLPVSVWLLSPSLYGRWRMQMLAVQDGLLPAPLLLLLLSWQRTGKLDPGEASPLARGTVL